MRALRTLMILLVVALARVCAAAEPAATLDDGRLDLSWFGPGLEFRHANEIDYLWVKPGFVLEGHRLRFAPFGEPQFLGKDAAKRNDKDRKLAAEMNPTLHELLAKQWSKTFRKQLTVVQEGEDVRIEGRIADCAKGPSSLMLIGPIPVGGIKHYAKLTVDLKFLDAATGELLVAIHHRSVKADWDDWVEDMTEQVEDDGFAKLYAKGKRVKD